MKNMKKIFALVLAVVMILAMGVTAFADDTDEDPTTEPAATGNTITVDKNFKGQEYTLYKIFNATVNDERKAENDADSDNSVNKAGIAYTLIDEDTTANSGHALTAEYSITTAAGETKTVKADDWFAYVNDSNKNIKIKDGVSITTEEFRLWAKAYGVRTGYKLTASSDDDTSIKWTGLADGYYFITTTTGSLVTVDSVAPNAIVKDKNSVPTVDKTVQEDSLLGASGADGDGTTAYQKQNDQEIGKTVYYKTVIAAKKGGTGYKLMDKMSDGLTFDGIANIKVYKGSVATANEVATGANTWSASLGGDYYAGADGTKEANAATFTLTISDAYLGALDADTNLIVLYTATVNSSAVVNTAMLNDTTLEYGNATRTAESETKTFVWGIDVLKHETGSESKVLKDAEFVIYRTETTGEGDEAKTSVYYAKFNSNNKLTGWSTADETAETELVKKEASYFTNATVLKTGADGKIAVTGLDEGTYKLLEVTAPAGYNKLDEAKAVTIDSTSDTETAKTLTTAISAGTSGSQNVTVANSAGATLPSTGSVGTTMFYIIGGVLVLAAVVVLVARKRASVKAE